MSSSGVWFLLGVLCLLGTSCSSVPVHDEHGYRGDFDSYAHGSTAGMQAIYAAPPYPGARYAISNGTGDVRNSYQSTVRVEFSEDGRDFCSGVLVNPYLVLTAAHCFCVKSGSQGETVIDKQSASCVRRASSVKAVLYGSPEGKGRRESSKNSSKNLPSFASARFEVSKGEMEVELHENYRSVIDTRGDVMESRADLAAIHLTEPIRGAAVAFKVPPRKEVEVGELLTMAGYGGTASEKEQEALGERYYGTNMVKVFSSRIDPKDREGRIKDGVFVFAGEGPDGRKAHAQSGDSGGPCFAQRDDGVWLVGIISMYGSIGDDSTPWSVFTSTFLHREWLRGQMEKSKARIEKLKSQSN